jgi:hypothetical protein
MGLFDTIYVSSDVAAVWKLLCRACRRPPEADYQWQTKSLDPCLHSYLLRHDESGVIRLYLLDRPSDRRFWRPWTEREIEESQRLSAESDDVFAFLRKNAGEGCFLPDAYLPQNRRQRFMGELPHQWVEIHGACGCGEFAEYWIKFCDGIAIELRAKPPTLEPEFFENAGDLEL